MAGRKGEGMKHTTIIVRYRYAVYHRVRPMEDDELNKLAEEGLRLVGAMAWNGMCYHYFEYQSTERVEEEDDEPPQTYGLHVPVEEKPDWASAPEWAGWRAKDKDGNWYWYQERPKKAKDFWGTEGYGRHEYAGTGQSDPKWRNSLEKRP